MSKLNSEIKNFISELEKYRTIFNDKKIIDSAKLTKSDISVLENTKFPTYNFYTSEMLYNPNMFDGIINYLNKNKITYGYASGYYNIVKNRARYILDPELEKIDNENAKKIQIKQNEIDSARINHYNAGENVRICESEISNAEININAAMLWLIPMIILFIISIIFLLKNTDNGWIAGIVISLLLIIYNIYNIFINKRRINKINTVDLPNKKNILANNKKIYEDIINKRGIKIY